MSRPQGIRALARLANLKDFRIEMNPFCEVFPEYQVYFLKALSALARIDGVDISPETRGEINIEPYCGVSSRLSRPISERMRDDATRILAVELCAPPSLGV